MTSRNLLKKLKAISRRRVVRLTAALIVLFVLFISAVNLDTRLTGGKLCRESKEFGGQSVCRQREKQTFYNEWEDQFGARWIPKHLFLSDMAFRHFASRYGFSTGTMYTFEFNPIADCYVYNRTPPAGCYEDVTRAKKIIFKYERRVLIYFTLWVAMSAVILHRLGNLMYKKLKAKGA